MSHTSATTGALVTSPGIYLVNDAGEVVGRYRHATTALADREHPGDHVIRLHAGGTWHTLND